MLNPVYKQISVLLNCLAMENDVNKINYISFNLDSTCFNVGLSCGFAIYNADPLKLRFQVLDKGDIKIVEVLFKTNMVAFVGSEKNETYPPNVLNVWDDQNSRVIGLLRYNEEIKCVKMRTDKIVVMTIKHIHVVDMKNFAEIERFDVEGYSPHCDICSISANKNNTVLAWKSGTIGHVNVKIFENNKHYVIKCHNSAIKYLTLNINGSLLATASMKGTLIRIFNTKTGQKIHEVRRGTVPAKIYSITFNRESSYIAVTSDKGTAHLFEIKNKNQTMNGTHNKQSSLSFMSSLLPSYFSSEWSFCQIQISPHVGNFIPAFGCKDKNTIIMITETGLYFKYKYKPGVVYTEALEKYKWFKS